LAALGAVKLKRSEADANPAEEKSGGGMNDVVSMIKVTTS
jgi:hypothetical protein